MGQISPDVREICLLTARHCYPIKDKGKLKIKWVYKDWLQKLFKPVGPLYEELQFVKMIELTLVPHSSA